MRTTLACNLATAIAVMLMPQFGLPASVCGARLQTQPTSTSKSKRRQLLRSEMKSNAV